MCKIKQRLGYNKIQYLLKNLTMQLSQDMTTQDFEHLLDLHKANPDDVDFITNIALVLMCNYHLNDEFGEDIKYFELAYKTKQTIETMHNYAFWLYFKYGHRNENQKLALKIQKECTKLHPDSYMPFLALARMYLDKKQFQNAITQYLTAKKMVNDEVLEQKIEHQIGCAYYGLAEYKIARNIFKSLPFERSLHNWVYCNLQLNDQSNFIASMVANELHLKSGTADESCYNDLAYFCALNGQYKQAYHYLLKEHTEDVDSMRGMLYSTEFAYTIWLENRQLFTELITDEVENNQKCINEIRQNHKDWQHLDEETKLQEIKDFQSDNEKYQQMDHQFLQSKPIFDMPDANWEWTGCLIFGCIACKLPRYIESSTKLIDSIAP